jgi:hypothetical protein
MNNLNVETVQAAVAGRNALSRSKWAERISAAWQTQVSSIFEVGTLLESARAELRRDEFSKLVKNDLPFSRSTATKLIAIAACDHVRNAAHGPHLPAHWRTLFELTLLTPAQFEHGISTATINPKMQRKDIAPLRGGEQKLAMKPHLTPTALLKQQVEESTRKIAHLQEQLAYAEQGKDIEYFDLMKDKPIKIAEAVIANAKKDKAIKIAEAILAATAKKQ